MWFVVSKKKHKEVLDEWGHEERNWHEIFSEQDAKIDEQAAILKSSEREKVLADLELALDLIKKYQRVVSSLSASDPNILKANALLEEYGMKGDHGATYLGFSVQGAPPSATTAQSKSVVSRPAETPEADQLSKITRDFPRKWKEEEEYWGDEAYGSGHVRIDAETIDEGDNKEPGYTRARIRYADLDAEEPPILSAAKATTEEASG